MKIKLTDDHRGNLYYDQWKYSINFRLENCYIARSLNIADLEEKIASRALWGFNTPLSSSTIKNLYNWVDFMTNTQTGYKLVVSHHWAYLYTNDQKLIDGISELPYIRRLHVKQACITRPYGTISLVTPHHRLRTYMRNQSISKEYVTILRDYLIAQDWRVGPGFLKMLDPNRKSHWISRYHFVDHNHEQETGFLNMIVPGIVGRTMPILAR